MKETDMNTMLATTDTMTLTLPLKGILLGVGAGVGQGAMRARVYGQTD